MSWHFTCHLYLKNLEKLHRDTEIFEVYERDVFKYSGVPRNFVRRGSTNSVEDRGRRERECGDGSPWSGVLEAAVIWYKKFHFI